MVFEQSHAMISLEDINHTKVFFQDDLLRSFTKTNVFSQDLWLQWFVYLYQLVKLIKHIAISNIFYFKNYTRRLWKLDEVLQYEFKAMDLTYKTYVLAGIFMLTVFHLCFGFYYVTIVDCLLHIGWTRALVTLKLERQLFVFIWFVSKQ
ncbi:hypothetical protein HanRHA438_Chr10g0463891 [Helianthus annuus]|nr:hypothetical protein HanRHA438_Chr10g0463891 [Helianthus annuus]